jgi:hypothetical protein
MTKSFWRDASERIAVTYIEAFAALLIASWTTDFAPSIIATAAWAAVPAALAALKGFVAQFRGDVDSASLSKRV